MNYGLAAFLCTVICVAIVIEVIDSRWNGYGFSRAFYIVEGIVFCVFAGLSVYCWVYVANHSHDYYNPKLENVERGEAHIDTIRMTTYYNNGDSAVSVKYVIEWNDKCSDGAAVN